MTACTKLKASVSLALLILLMRPLALAQYCPVSFTSYPTCVGGNITNVTVAGINHSVTCLPGGGYRDLTSTVAAGTVQPGSTIPISLTIGGGGWFGGAGVWIDLNQNLIFEPAERVFSSPYTSGNSLHTGTITIPASATPGATTMRVIGNESTSPTTACGSQTYGEAQDYKIIVIGGSYNNAGIEAVTAPQNLGFCAGNQDIKVRLKNFGKNMINNVTIDWSVDGIMQTPFFWSGPLDTIGSTTNKSDTVLILGNIPFGTASRAIKAWTSMPNSVADTSNLDDTLTRNIQPKINCATLPTYCTPTFSTWSTCIGGAVAAVNFAGMSSTTPCLTGGGYRDLTNSVLAPIVTKGQSYPVSITIGSSYPTGGGGAVYIDYNRDGIFDAGELAFTGTYNNTNPTPYTYSGNILIPFTAIPGYTLMRVVGRESTGATTACGSGYGEVNDYAVLIANGTPNNAGVATISPATGTFCAGNQDIKARIRNNGNNIINSVQVEWSVDGIMQTPLFWTSPIDTAGGALPGDTLLTLGQVNFASASSVKTIKVWTSMPNNVADTSNADDTLVTTIQPSAVGSCAAIVLPTYCTPTFTSWTTSCVGGAINNVTFAGINRNEACAATGSGYYKDLTTTVAPAVVAPGFSYPVSVSVGAATYVGGVSIWIDFNKNGVFELTEKVYTDAPGTLSPQVHTGTIVIPMTAPSGYTVMRVVGVENSTPNDPCGSGYGEAHDYVVKINERAGNNMAVKSLVSPVSFCAGTHNVAVRIGNNGKNQVHNLLVEWTLNGVAQATFSWTGTIDTLGGTGFNDTAIVLGSVNFTAGVPENIRIWTSYPNSVADTTNSDDTLTLTLKPALNGIYTIGAGGNFASFTDAAADLNSAGACGPVTFNIAAGSVFSEAPVRISKVGSAGAPIQFVKTGTGANPLINGTAGTGSADAVITLEGASYITFDGIDVKDNTGNTTSATQMEYGFRLVNSDTKGASNNSIKNSKIILNRTNTASAGVVQSSTTAIAGGLASSGLQMANHNNLYENVRIENAYQGFWIGATASYPDSNTVITSNGSDTTVVGSGSANDIGNGSSAVSGIYLSNQKNASVTKTVIRNLTHTSTSTVQGIYLDNVSSSSNYGQAQISGNIIHTINRTNTSTSSSTHVHGIRIELSASATAMVTNNVVYNIISTGNTSSANANQAVRGISYGTATGNGTAYFYNNTVSINNPSLNRTSAVFWKGSNGTVVLKNNIFSNTTAAQSGVAKHFVIYRNAGTITASNNLYWTTNTNGFTGYYTSDQASINNWKTASAQDANSVFYRPAFTSAVNLQPSASDSAVWAINGRGIQLPEVSADINGAARSVTIAAGAPDLGAFEITPSAEPPAAIAIPTTPAAGTTQVFMFAEDTIAKIEWDAVSAVPATISMKHHSGAFAPGSMATDFRTNVYWTLNAPAGNYSYNLLLCYKNTMLGTIPNESDMKTAKHANGSWSFYLGGSSNSNITSKVLRTELVTDHAALFTGTDNTIPLPVGLVSLEAKAAGDNVDLYWSTASETNNQGFTILRSADGKSWEKIGSVKGAGNSSELIAYEYADATSPLLVSGKIYYRLQQTDLSGKTLLSDIVSVTKENMHKPAITVFPNPFSSSIGITVASSPSSHIDITLRDLSGKTVLTGAYQAPLNTVKIDHLDQLQAGVYFLSISGDRLTETVKVIKY